MKTAACDLTVDGDGEWYYDCPKCYAPFHPLIRGRGRQCQPAPTLAYQADGDWLQPTCGRCGYVDPGKEQEPTLC